MALPTGWPPRPASGTRSLRFYQTGTTTGNYSDNAYLFSGEASANPYTPLPYVAPGSTAPVAFGDLTKSGSPMGGGQNAHDAVPDPQVSQVPPPTSMIWCRAMRIHNTGVVDLTFSFDGTNDHGLVPAGTNEIYFDRFEAGIAVKDNGGGTHATFVIEAW